MDVLYIHRASSFNGQPETFHCTLSPMYFVLMHRENPSAVPCTFCISCHVMAFVKCKKCFVESCTFVFVYFVFYNAGANAFSESDSLPPTKFQDWIGWCGPTSSSLCHLSPWISVRISWQSHMKPMVWMLLLQVQLLIIFVYFKPPKISWSALTIHFPRQRGEFYTTDIPKIWLKVFKTGCLDSTENFS